MVCSICADVSVERDRSELIDDCIVSGVDACNDGTGFATLAYTCRCLTFPLETWRLLESESESSITRIVSGGV